MVRLARNQYDIATSVTIIFYAQGTYVQCIDVASCAAWWFIQAIRIHEAPVAMCIYVAS